jgi:hypothetical protein
MIGWVERERSVFAGNKWLLLFLLFGGLICKDRSGDGAEFVSMNDFYLVGFS